MVRETLTLTESTKINSRNLNIWYGDHHAIINADLQIMINLGVVEVSREKKIRYI